MAENTFRPPQSVREEARRALTWIGEGKAGQGFTSVGRRRASQLANGQPVSVATLKRMRSYFARHAVDSQGGGYKPGEPGYPSAGRVAWAAWGGDAGRSWANGILRSVEADKKADKGPEREQALRVARMVGCRGAHQNEDGVWMPCASAEELSRRSTAAETSANVPGETKEKKKKRRGQWQNLIEKPIAGIDTLPGGGLVSAPIAGKAARKARGDRLAATPALPKERIRGSSRNAPGTASSVGSGKDISIDAQTDAALIAKVKEHNDSVAGDEAWKRTSVAALRSVYRRGAGAFSVSHRPGMTRNQWAMGRVNAFLKILKSGKPKNSRYVGDNDLLPQEHPWRKGR